MENNIENNLMDESSKETSRQNALLKQLLQNCPSADLNPPSVKKQTEAEPFIDKPVVHELNEIKLESNVESLSQCMELSKKCENIDFSEANIKIEKSNIQESCNSEQTNEVNPSIINNSNIAANPTVEKKLSYLDIRRAQLERDPTPPPEDLKPKRKRPLKRKDSNKSIDEADNAQQSNKVSKKRPRKGSQTKNDENSGENNEQALASILAQLKSKPALSIVEPEIKQNLNVCLPSDAGDQNCSESKLKGCFGNAFLTSTIDYYSTYPFGPNKASVVPSIPPSINNSTNSHSRGYYNEEFSRNFQDLDEHFKEQNVGQKLFSFNDRDLDSPDTIISASSPGSFYDEIQDDYNKMKFINDKPDDADSESRMSPLIPFVHLPIRPTPKYSNGIQDILDHDKENRHDIKKLKSSKVNLSYPLKESGNVGITLMVTSDQNIKTILFSLAKLLKITSSFTYNIENSSLITEVLNIEKENRYCKFCDCLIQTDKNGGDSDSFVKKSDDSYFCNKDCFKKYSISFNFGDSNEKLDEISNENIDIDMNSLDDITSESIEKEIADIFDNSQSSDIMESTESENLDALINIEEKRWKNTRYLYWNKSSFKPPQNSQDDSLENEECFEQLDTYLKPAKNSQEKRICIFCHELGDGVANGTSRLLNMDINKWIHLNCALWSNEVYEMLNGALMNVDQAYKRSMDLSCVRCCMNGASLRCFKLRCSNSYHFPCAIKDKCTFFKDKTIFCPSHSPKGTQFISEELTSFVVHRKVYINRDEQKQIAAMIHQGDNNLMRIGSLIFINIGQLLPHQLQNFHTNSCIYPVGYKVSRFYWSSRKLGKRCQYICSINEVDGKPEFNIEVREDGYENVTFSASSPKLVWQKIIESVSKLREESQTIKVFFDFISGEDLFGLNEPAIIRILESLPGVDTLYDYNFKFGRSPWYELPLAINPTGCARTEPKMRTHFKRPHTLHVSSNPARSSIQSSMSTGESLSPYVKQFVHSKVSQYRKMKQEWRNNVYLGRSHIQGLGLYAVRDIEKHTMIIEYIGLLIRNEIAERNERVHEAHVSILFYSIYFSSNNSI